MGTPTHLRACSLCPSLSLSHTHLHPQGLEEAINIGATKDLEQLVIQPQKEARAAGITLMTFSKVTLSQLLDTTTIRRTCENFESARDPRTVFEKILKSSLNCHVVWSI